MKLRHLLIIASVAALPSAAFAESTKGEAKMGAGANVETPAGRVGAGANVDANRGASPGAGAHGTAAADAAIDKDKRARGATTGAGADASVSGKRSNETAPAR